MAIAIPTPATTSREGPGDKSTTTPWLSRNILGLSAVLTWVALAAALLCEHLLDTPRPLELTLYVVAYLAGGTLATRTAITDLFEGTVNIDLLMVLAAIGAAFLGAWAEGATLLALFSSSNALEHYALGRTRSAVRSLMDLRPSTARVLVDGQERVVGVDDLTPGDMVIVRPGEKIPADAEIVDGITEVDQSAITGESMPVTRTTHDIVFAGTMNGSGAFRARVTAPASETTIARIGRMVEEAQAQKSRAERFTDSFEGPYAIGVIAAAILTGVISLLLGDSQGSSFYRAITLLVVASPCALVISTPASTLSAIASAARGGVLVKGGSHLDALGTVKTIAFDKTGTLTIGKPALTDIIVLNHRTENDVLQVIATAEHLSEHPLARAIVEEATRRGIPTTNPESFGSDPGRGVTASVNGTDVSVGNESLFATMDITVPDDVTDIANGIRAQGRTAILAGDRNGIFAVVGIADRVRPGAAEALAGLREKGIEHIVMLTGDNKLVGEAIGRQLGIDEVYTDLHPDEKLDKIEELKKRGKIAMVGDGVNDAPALATADLGIAMGAGGTDVALETADVVLITGDLRRIPFAIGLSRRMRKIIRLSIAFALSVIAVLALTTLFSGIPLTLGVIGHEGSTVIVVLAGLTLLAYRPEKPKPTRMAS